MKPLTIELVKGQRRSVQSIGWKEPGEGRLRLQCYLLGEAGKPLVLSMGPAVPRFWVPGREVVASKELFPEAVCIEITPCRLLPPPCFGSQADFERQRAVGFLLDPWRAFYWATHGEVLIPGTEHDQLLQGALDKFLDAKRNAYEAERRLCRAEEERLTKGTLNELLLTSEEERQGLLEEIRERLGTLESDSRTGGHPDLVPCAGWLRLTLDDVRQGVTGIRDALLQQEWATLNGEDLAAMRRERRNFRDWLMKHTGTRSILLNGQTNRSSEGIAVPDLEGDYESNGQFQEACANVRYRARFADSKDTVVYLAVVEPLREELSAGELVEVAKLTGTWLKDPAEPGNTSTGDQTGQSAETLITSAAGRIEGLIKDLTITSDVFVARIVAKAEALANTIEPLNRLYREVELSELRKTAIGRGVPDLFVDWVMSSFQASNPPRLPTKGDAFDHCGPGTILGKKLKQGNHGVSKQRLADHLTTIRRLLEDRGWLTKRKGGSASNRPSRPQSIDQFEDRNQPSPAEIAEDRDEERQRTRDPRANDAEDGG